MFHDGFRSLFVASMALACTLPILGSEALADGSGTRLTVLYPPGGQAGTSVEVRVGGVGLEGPTGLKCDEPRITSAPLGNQRFTLTIPKDIPPGLYDLRASGAFGLSSPRSFFVTPRKTLVESAANQAKESKRIVSLDVSVCGIIEKPGNVDVYQFHAEAGQRVVIDCWAERLDSETPGYPGNGGRSRPASRLESRLYRAGSFGRFFCAGCRQLHRTGL